MRAALALPVVLAATLSAWGALAAPCAPAAAPDVALKPERPKLPEKPSCLDAKGGCPGWEAYSYNDAIKAYVDGSVAYANCELKSLQ